MNERRQPDPSLLLRVGGVSALVAGALFFFTVVYAFVAMSRFGFTQEMFDDRALLLPWVADHADLYRGLWLLYFASQVFLLPVPLALYTLIRHDGPGAGIAAPCAVAGGAAVVMAMVGLVVIYATFAPVARAFVETSSSSPERASVLLLGDLFADVGKEVRLFSELLLGVWLGGTGAALLLRGTRSDAAGWAILIISGCTLCVAILKILDPLNPLEDCLGLLLAGGYVVIGVRLLRE